jgi:tRNA pseudouridine55 synthase
MPRNRPITGVLLLDKPAGISSNAALQRAKHIFRAAKAGHTGTLDPLATGLLPICFGEATKFSSFLLDASKVYEATLQLGVRTTTGDSEGEIVERREANIERDAFVQALREFTGIIRQTPPLYSALKRDGRPLYEYARAGIDVPREAREVIVTSIELIAFAAPQAAIRVACGKGTYIRTLAEDIGSGLGCGAHLTALRRTRCADLTIERALGFDSIEAMSEAEREAALLPDDALLLALPRAELGEGDVRFLRQGRALAWPHAAPSESVRLYARSGTFVGVGTILDGTLRARRLRAYDVVGIEDRGVSITISSPSEGED